MPTNLAIDDRLIDEARVVGGHKTKKEAVTTALREYIKRHKQRRILELVDQIAYDPAYDYKATRRLGSAAPSWLPTNRPRRCIRG